MSNIKKSLDWMPLHSSAKKDPAPTVSQPYRDKGRAGAADLKKDKAVSLLFGGTRKRRLI